MPDSTAGADALDLPETATVGDPSAGKPAAEPTAGAGGALTVGRRWRNFTVKAELPGPPSGCYHAVDVSVMQDVVVQARPVGPDTEARRNVWQMLQGLPGEIFAYASEAHEEGGYRYEVFPDPEGQSLREWLGAHRSNVAMVENVVQQLAHAIETLHQAGLAHLNLRPETVFIAEDDQKLKIMIGGLHRALLIEQEGLVTIEANPYYSPPETGGLFQHEAGDGLQAWDWWALGRIVQEMVLGRHVYSLIMERDVRDNPPELRPRAEALLLERDPTGVKPGAVELLPEDTSPRLRMILRGLLASVRDGRWRWAQVETWLRGDQPVDRYDLPRNTRLIRRGEHALTLVEIADLYAQPAHFAEGVGQLFPEEGAKESVWQILEDTPQFRTELDRVRPLREMMTMPPWQGQPDAMRQAAVAGLIWLTLAAPGQRRPLCFGAYVLTVAGLRRMFRERAELAEAALGVLTAEPYLQRVSPLDPVARKALDSLAKPGREAVAIAKNQGWTSLIQPTGQAKLLEWILASDAELQARCDGLRARYATSTDARLDAWLRASAPSRVEQALLAASGDSPEQHGYVTHEEWSRRRHAELIARATVLTRALHWRRLERLIVCTPALLGFWPVAAAIWLVPLVLMLMAHAWLLAALTILAAAVSRVAGTLATRGMIARHLPGCAPWRWTDDATRCRREAHALLPNEERAPIAKLEAEMGRIRHELSRLVLPSGLAQPPESPRLGVLWARAVVAMATPLVLLMSVVAPHHSILGKSASQAADATAKVQAPEQPTLVEEIGPDGKVVLFEIVQDGFGGRRRGPLKPWDIPKPAAAVPLQVMDRSAASGGQSAFAVVSAELLLAPYPRQGRNVLVAVAVPRPKGSRPAILLYDSATNRLADGWSYGVGSDLTPSTWYNLTGRDVVYLGLPSAMEGEDLIPLP
jgi:hypothetical protein